MAVVAVVVVVVVPSALSPQSPHMTGHCFKNAGTAHAPTPMLAHDASSFLSLQPLSVGHVPQVCGHPASTLGSEHHTASSPAHEASSVQLARPPGFVVVVLVVSAVVAVVAVATSPSQGAWHKLGQPSLTAGMSSHMLLSNPAQSARSSPRLLHLPAPPWSLLETHLPHSLGQFV